MNSPNSEKPMYYCTFFNILPLNKENLQIIRNIGCPDTFVIRKLKCTSIYYFTHLHQFHDWDRVEEMQSTKLVSPASDSSNLSDGEGGGVAGKHRGTENERKREKYPKWLFNCAAVFYVIQFTIFHHFIVQYVSRSYSKASKDRKMRIERDKERKNKRQRDEKNRKRQYDSRHIEKNEERECVRKKLLATWEQLCRES